MKIRDREFVKTIPNAEIKEGVKRVSAQINKDYSGKCPLLLGVLNGAFMFAAELMQTLEIECEISFVKFSSYSGTDTTGKVREVIGLNESIAGRDIIIIEDKLP